MWRINGPSGFFTPDTAGYVGPAESLLHGSFTFLGLPEIFRTPGYPLLLVPAIAMKHVVVVTLLENHLLATVSAWLVWRITTDVFPGSRAAFWAVLLFSMEPSGFLYSEKIISETAFITFFLFFVSTLVRFLRQPRYAKLAVSAFALGCATYIRPVPIYLALWLVPVLLLFPDTLSLRQRLLRAIFFPVIFGLTLTPWIIRNNRVADYRAFSSTPDLDLYFYSAAAVQAKLEHKSFSQVQEELGWFDRERYFQTHPEQRTWSQGRMARSCRAQASEIILSHLGSYLVIHATGCARVVFNPGVTEFLMDVGQYPASGGLIPSKLDQGLFRATLWLFREYPLAAVALPLMAAQLIFYYGLALAGMRRLPASVRSLFAAVALYYILVSGIPGAVSRWRAPIMPLVCVCAGAAVAQWRVKESYVTARATAT
ncbi:MAG TPA: glycosyltransferase family 39 protein [Candidatus Angelobacter sp.]|nr:glycosyltransferase family 39 protein [Candidatus Angelobacter sp.]